MRHGGLTGLGSVRTTYCRVAEVYRDSGIALVALGAINALLIMAVVSPGRYFLLESALATAVWVVGYEVLVGRRGRWLSTMVSRADVLPAEVHVSRHRRVNAGSALEVGTFGGLSAIFALLVTHVGLNPVLLVIVIAGMVGAGVGQLVRTVRVRNWERDEDSALLVAETDWSLREQPAVVGRRTRGAVRGAPPLSD